MVVVVVVTVLTERVITTLLDVNRVIGAEITPGGSRREASRRGRRGWPDGDAHVTREASSSTRALTGAAGSPRGGLAVGRGRAGGVEHRVEILLGVVVEVERLARLCQTLPPARDALHLLEHLGWG